MHRKQTTADITIPTTKHGADWSVSLPWHNWLTYIDAHTHPRCTYFPPGFLLDSWVMSQIRLGYDSTVSNSTSRPCSTTFSDIRKNMLNRKSLSQTWLNSDSNALGQNDRVKNTIWLLLQRWGSKVKSLGLSHEPEPIQSEKKTESSTTLLPTNYLNKRFHAISLKTVAIRKTEPQLAGSAWTLECPAAQRCSAVQHHTCVQAA